MEILQILIAIALIVVIILQAKGTGLGAAWGGGGELYHSKRGVEKVLFTSTIVLAVIFVVLSMISAL